MLFLQHFCGAMASIAATQGEKQRAGRSDGKHRSYARRGAVGGVERWQASQLREGYMADGHVSLA